MDGDDADESEQRRVMAPAANLGTQGDRVTSARLPARARSHDRVAVDLAG